MCELNTIYYFVHKKLNRKDQFVVQFKQVFEHTFFFFFLSFVIQSNCITYIINTTRKYFLFAMRKIVRSIKSDSKTDLRCKTVDNVRGQFEIVFNMYANTRMQSGNKSFVVRPS